MVVDEATSDDNSVVALSTAKVIGFFFFLGDCSLVDGRLRLVELGTDAVLTLAVVLYWQ